MGQKEQNTSDYYIERQLETYWSRKWEVRLNYKKEYFIVDK